MSAAQLRSALLAGAAALACIGVPRFAPAQNSPADPSRTIGEVAKRKVEVHADTPAAASSSRAMENYRRFLELQNSDPKLRAEALRRLGDLNLDAGEMERLEQEVTAIDLQGAEAIRLY